MGRRARGNADVFFIQRDRANLFKKMPYFLLAITALLSMNILLLLQQQPSGDGLPVVQTEFLDSRRLRQYVENSGDHTVHMPVNAQQPVASQRKLETIVSTKNQLKFLEPDGSSQNQAQDVEIKQEEVKVDPPTEPTKKPPIQPSTKKPTTKKPTTKSAKTQPAAPTTKRAIVIPDANIEYNGNYPDPVVKGKSPKNTLPPLEAGAYITPNEILQRAAVAIKTFNRAECLMTTVASFRASYPDIPIFVADDSFEDTVSDNLTATYDITYIRLAPDSGVGYGRNRLVDHLFKMGYQYMIMSDDDYTVEQHDLLLMMAEHMINTAADAVAPLRCDYGHCERSKGMIHMSRDGDLTVFPNMTSYPDEKVSTCHRSDLMQQFFLTKTATLAKTHWDDKLKNNDHYDFLFSAKRAGLRLVTCTDIKVMHNKKICQDKVTAELMENYLHVRAERWLNLTSHVFQKWKIRMLFDETGKQISLDEQTKRPIIKPVERVVVNATNPYRKYFEQAILDHYNDRNPGWYSIKIVPNSRKTYIVYKQLNRCMYWLGGKLDTKYDRHESFPNKNQVISFEFHHINRSCPIAEDFWKLNKFGKQEKTHVYLITAVSNDPIHMDRLLGLVNNQTNRQYITFVVVDMGKEDEKYDLSKHEVLVNTEYLYLGGPFSRSIGLKRGFDFAKSIALKKGHTDAIGFSIDTSIMIPANFSEIIRSHTRCGLSAYAPVCYKHKDPGGYWVTTGYGMIAACFEDYDKIGGWDTRWGYRWGAEDVDIMNRMQKHLPFTVRTKEDKFEHIHSGSTRTNYKGYYTHKNLYDGQLPVTPLSTPVTDEVLKQRLYKWALPKMKYPINLIGSSVLATHNPITHTTMYDVRFKNDLGEEYYSVVESVL